SLRRRRPVVNGAHASAGATNRRPIVVERARPPERPTVTILGVEVDRRSGDDVLAEVRQRVGAGERLTLNYVNAHTLNLSRRDKRLRAALADSSLVLNDGIGV